jgi:UDP-N-acetylmuramate--alanine ligase
VLTGIYGAGEEPLPGITLDALGAAVKRSTTVPVDLVESLEEVPHAVARVARPGDMVITLGAGSIGTLPDRLIALLGRGGAR